MPIKTSCPNCDATYTLADTMRGKQVKCKHCQEAFTVRGTRLENAPARAEDDEADEAGIRPSRPVRAAARPAYDDEDDYPRRRRPDDDYDDDYAPRRRQGGGSKVGLIIGICVGALLLIGGGVTAIIVLTGKEKTPEEQLAEEIEREFRNADLEVPRDMMRDGFPGDGFRGDRPKFGDFNPRDLGRDLGRPRDVGIDARPPFDGTQPPPKPLTFADHLSNLKGNDERVRHEALRFIAGRDPNVAERGEVAKALAAYADDSNGRTDVVRELTRWAGKEQVPTLLKHVAHGDILARQQVIETLGRLKDERAIAPIAGRLTDVFDVNHARQALESIGPAAAPHVVPLRFHKDGNVRSQVVQLLKIYNTPAETILAQAVKDLASNEREVYMAVTEYLSQTPPSDKVRADVVRGLEGLLKNPQARYAAFRALQAWATAENVPSLTKLLDDDNVPRDQLLGLLGKLKDPRAAEAIAKRLAGPIERRHAAAALKEIGPAAESAVLPYLNHADRGAQEEANKLLKDYGTKPDVILIQTIKDLAAEPKKQKEHACERLTKTPVDDKRRAEVTKALEPLFNDSDRLVQLHSQKAFVHWAGPDNLAQLVTLVTAEKSDHRKEAIEALAKIKDLKASYAIASRVPNFFDRGHASKALKTMGQWAERPAVELLGHQDRGVRIEAVQILQVVGTKKAIAFLQQSAKAHAKDQDYLGKIGSAIQAIQAR